MRSAAEVPAVTAADRGHLRAYWPLLDFGQLDALINLQEARAYELLVNYRKTILAAVEDVDTAINRYRAALQQLRSLEEALAESQKAVDLAKERYERGLTVRLAKDTDT